MKNLWTVQIIGGFFFIQKDLLFHFNYFVFNFLLRFVYEYIFILLTFFFQEDLKLSSKIFVIFTKQGLKMFLNIHSGYFI